MSINDGETLWLFWVGDLGSYLVNYRYYVHIYCNFCEKNTKNSISMLIFKILSEKRNPYVGSI